MKRSIPIIVLLTLFLSCSKVDLKKIQADQVANKVLMLKVDYTTSKFEGGKEFTFKNPTQSFTIDNEYHAPGDFGSIKLIYQELNEPLFDGTIIWMGSGKMAFPADLQPPSKFTSVLTQDIVYPINGFQNVFNPNNEDYDYTTAWMAIEHLVKVREYLKSNPGETVKIFLYTPSVGVGNPADWDWIIYLKN
ncbi:MAG: hypothetical protein ACTHM7_15625 [Ginsengibacter sp.]